MKKIIDLNYLRTPDLDAYLASGNLGVLCEFHFMEMSKGASIANVRASLLKVARFPEQFLVCKSAEDIIQLTGQGLLENQDDLIDTNATRNIGSFCQHILSPDIEGGKDSVFDKLTSEAKAFFLQNRLGAQQVAAYVKLALDRKLTDLEKKKLRNTQTIDPIHYMWMRDEASLLSDRMLTAKGYKIQSIKDCLAYRYILSGYALCMYWISMGGLDSLPIDSLVNDITDMMYVAVASYFDGILTHEKKVLWAYQHLMQLIGLK